MRKQNVHMPCLKGVSALWEITCPFQRPMPWWLQDSSEVVKPSHKGSFPSSGTETRAGRAAAVRRRCRTSLWKTGTKGRGEASWDGGACQVCLIPVRCQLPPLLLTINVTDRCLMPVSAYNHAWWKDLRLWCCQWILCQTGNLYLVFTSLEVT